MEDEEKEEIEQYWESFGLDKHEALGLEVVFNEMIKEKESLEEIHKEICKRWSKGSKHDFLIFWMGYAVKTEEVKDENDENVENP